MTRGRALALLLATVALLCACSSPPRPGLPNLVIITLDTTRADALGCYGQPRPNSPNIDRLEQQEDVFEQVVAQAAVTPVSHASILTGLNPPRHGLRALHGFDDDRSILTLGEMSQRS